MHPSTWSWLSPNTRANERVTKLPQLAHSGMIVTQSCNLAQTPTAHNGFPGFAELPTVPDSSALTPGILPGFNRELFGV